MTGKKKILSPSSWRKPEDHLEILLTNPWYKVLNKIFYNIIYLTSDFYQKEGIEASLFPVTTGSISSPMGLGSDSVPIKIKINNQDVYLADSMQFCLEIGARLNKKGAYYIMPTFRGENTDARHLNEFLHSEVEIKGNIDDIRNLAERYIKYLTEGLLSSCADDIISVAGEVKHMEQSLKKDFQKIPFENAVSELKTLENTCILGEAPQITSIGEKVLVKKYGDFIWLTELPWKMVPFYQAHMPDRKKAFASDLLAGIGEILGCGQRVFSAQDLDDSLNAHQVSLDEYQWYRKMREIEPVQTSGFGLGLERYILWVLKHNDIRDCTLLLRNHNHFEGP